MSDRQPDLVEFPLNLNYLDPTEAAPSYDRVVRTGRRIRRRRRTLQATGAACVLLLAGWLGTPLLDRVVQGEDPAAVPGCPAVTALPVVHSLDLGGGRTATARAAVTGTGQVCYAVEGTYPTAGWLPATGQRTGLPVRPRLVEAGDGAGFVFGAVPGAGGTGTTLRLTLADQLDSRLDPPLTLDGSTGPRPYALAVLVSGGAADGLRVELVDGAGRVAASEPVERG